MRLPHSCAECIYAAWCGFRRPQPSRSGQDRSLQAVLKQFRRPVGAGHARPLQGGGIVLKRLVGSGLDRSGKVAGDGNRTRRHIYIPRNYAAAAQRRGGVKTPPYSTDDLR